MDYDKLNNHYYEIDKIFNACKNRTDVLSTQVPIKGMIFEWNLMDEMHDKVMNYYYSTLNNVFKYFVK